MAEEAKSGGSAVDAMMARMAQEKEEQEARDLEAIEAQAAASEAFREEYEASDRGLVARQIREAEEAMRGPHPVAGFVVGDPTQGPSS
jgi:hypothetical protein